MADIIPFGRRPDRYTQTQDAIRHIAIPAILQETVLQTDLSGDGNGPEILDKYQQDIVSGVPARDALKTAILRAREL